MYYREKSWKDVFFIALQYNTETQTQLNMTDSHHHVVNFYSLFELYIWRPWSFWEQL